MPITVAGAPLQNFPRDSKGQLKAGSPAQAHKEQVLNTRTYGTHATVLDGVLMVGSYVAF